MMSQFMDLQEDFEKKVILRYFGYTSLTIGIISSSRDHIPRNGKKSDK